MKKLLFFAFLGLLFTNCVTNQKYATFIDQKVKPYRTPPSPKDWLQVNAAPARSAENDCKQLKFKFIPAILYWGWNSTIEWELNSNVKNNYLRKSIYAAADSLHVKEWLAGKRLEINLKQVPGKFLYTNKGYTVFLVFSYATGSEESIKPYPINLEYDYLVKENNQVISEGAGVIRNEEQPMMNVWKSTKKFTWLYLDGYQKETECLGWEIVKEIKGQLEGKE
ncbi:MAG: hypothetical protein KGS48_14240 [Bacteroidetes bacterium]|nr:hypothetical protein [Bacteroidota bacterium]